MKVTKIGHSTLIIEMGGQTILTDPWMTEPIYTRFTHREPLPMTPDQLSGIDLILATHSHDDHFDPGTLRKLDKSIPIYCPGGDMIKKAKDLGFSKIHTLRPDDRVTVGKLTITATPARHLVPEIGFVLQSGEGTLYFAGDTQRDERLFRLGEKFQIDVAVLPIGGSPYPLMIREELDPTEAAELAGKLNAPYVLPINYDLAQPARFTGDHVLTSHEVLDRFQAAMKDRHPKGRALILAAGESWQMR